MSAKQQAVLSPENLAHLKTDLIYVSLNLSLVNDNIMAHHHSPCCVKLEKALVISFLLEILTQTCQLPILSFYIFNSQRENQIDSIYDQFLSWQSTELSTYACSICLNWISLSIQRSFCQSLLMFHHWVWRETAGVWFNLNPRYQKLFKVDVRKKKY